MNSSRAVKPTLSLLFNLSRESSQVFSSSRAHTATPGEDKPWEPLYSITEEPPLKARACEKDNTVSATKQQIRLGVRALRAILKRHTINI